MLERIETYTVVYDFESDLLVTQREGELRVGGLRVLDDVLQAFLRDAVQRDLDVVGQPGIRQLDVDVDRWDRPRQAGQPARQPEVVEHRRAQPVDRRASLAEREIDEFASQRQLFSSRGGIVANGSAGGVQPVGQRDEPLTDAVVDVAGQPAAFEFLRLDDLLDEVLVRTIAGHQLAVHPRLVHGARDEPTDDEEQFHVAVGELTALHGVHVEDADQSAWVGLHRHRDHRGEVRTAQRLERLVPRIGLLVVDDHDRLAMAGDPAGYPLPQGKSNLADLAVEGWRRA